MTFRVSLPIAKQRIDGLASEFQSLAGDALNAGTGDQIVELRSRYEKLLARSKVVLCQCLQEKQDVDSFILETQLQLVLEPTHSDERKAVLASAQRGRNILAGWVRILD